MREVDPRRRARFTRQRSVAVRAPLGVAYVVRLRAMLAAHPLAAHLAVADVVPAREDVLASPHRDVFAALIALRRAVEQRREGVV